MSDYLFEGAWSDDPSLPVWVGFHSPGCAAGAKVYSSQAASRKNIMQRQKVLIGQVFFSQEFPRGFLIKKRFFPGAYRLSTVISGL